MLFAVDHPAPDLKTRRFGSLRVSFRDFNVPWHSRWYFRIPLHILSFYLLQCSPCPLPGLDVLNASGIVMLGRSRLVLHSLAFLAGRTCLLERLLLRRAVLDHHYEAAFTKSARLCSAEAVLVVVLLYRSPG